MAKRRLMVYLDPGFLENRGHYMNFSKHIHAEAARRHIELRHFVNSATSNEYCVANGLVPMFARTAYLADSTRHEEAQEIVNAIDEGFAHIVATVDADAGNYDEIVYYMYTGHPTYVSSLALHLSRHAHAGASVSANLVLFYLSDRFSYGNDDGRYANYLKRVSRQLDAFDPAGAIQVGIDSDTALSAHAAHFSRALTVVPFPHVQRAEIPRFPVKPSTKSKRPRVTYSGYPHSKYGFHLVLALLERSLTYPLWQGVDFELKLNSKLKEDDLVNRWDALKGKLKNLHLHEGYMDDAEYDAMIRWSDVLLVPYGSQYNHDTSAVLVDGLLNGCVIIAAEPTWMAKVFAQHGSGRTYLAEDSDSFIEAAIDAVTNLADYKRRSKHNISGLGSKFSAEGLFDVLFPRWRVTSGASTGQGVMLEAGVVPKEIIVPPAMVGRYPLREIDMTQEQLLNELTELKQQAVGLNAEFLPSDKIPLPQRVADLRAITIAWGEREIHKARFKAITSRPMAGRCVVLGPNVLLDPETMKTLQNEVVFAPQQTYRQFQETGILPKYVVMESAAFIQNNIDDLQKLRGVTKFMPYHFAHLFPDDADVVHFNHQPRKSYPDGYDISLQAQDVTYTSCTVVGTALQLAMSLGFRQICLLGVDVTEGVDDKVELEKLYFEAARVAKANRIELVNVCFDTTVPHVDFANIEPFSSTQQRALAVLVAATAGKLDRNWSQQELEIAERVLLNKHPCPSDIYLPTTKYQGLERVAAIQKVVKAWNDRQSIHKSRLREAKTRMQGRKRCFIIGNGPSLNQTNLDLLTDEVTFATNGIFLKFGDTKFRPTFFVVEDHLVGEDRYQEINQLRGFTKLAPYYLAYCLEDRDDVVYYNHRSRISYPHGFDFSKNAEEITYTGCTVTFSCMQLAYYMGFTEIYLIGVDMSYVIPEEVKKANEYDTEILDMEVDDPNHFIPNYFGRGYRWHDPNVDKMEQAYVEARKVTEMNGVKIFNATVGGKCEVFDRVNYYELFGKLSPVARLGVPIRAGTYSSNSANCLIVNRAVSSQQPLEISAHFDRSRSRILVVEIGSEARVDQLQRLSIKLDGLNIPYTVNAADAPCVVSLLMPAGQGGLTLEISLAQAVEENDCEIQIERLHSVPVRSFIKSAFPFSHFDGLQYLRNNPDVAREVEECRELSALSHYLQKGRGEGREFVFATDVRPNHGWRFELDNRNHILEH